MLNTTDRDPRLDASAIAGATTVEELIDARAAAGLLGIKMQTLYAYVSRGLVRTVSSDRVRGNLYYREDVESVRLKGRMRRSPDEAVERLIRWGGGAVLHTAITDITPRGHRYRGLSAIELATAHRPFEDVAELLWTGVLPESSVAWEPLHITPHCERLLSQLSDVCEGGDTHRLLALCAHLHAISLGGPPEQVFTSPVMAGRQLLQVMAPAFGLLLKPPLSRWGPPGSGIAATLLRALGQGPPDEAVKAVDAALVLCADHALAPSTFAARIAASAGADLYASVSTALGAFNGPLAGMGCDQAEQLLREHRSPHDYLAALRALLKRRLPPSGYGHPLYTAGDPRGAHLLGLAAELPSPHPAGRAALQAAQLATRELGLMPGLPVGVVVLCMALGLPPRTPGALIALGRSAGWVAHALEQRLGGFLVRPHARYVGP